MATKEKLRHVIQDGEVYLCASDLAFVLDERGEIARRADSSSNGFPGTLVKDIFSEVAMFIRTVARDRCVC